MLQSFLINDFTYSLSHSTNNVPNHLHRPRRIWSLISKGNAGGWIRRRGGSKVQRIQRSDSIPRTRKGTSNSIYEIFSDTVNEYWYIIGKADFYRVKITYWIRHAGILATIRKFWFFLAALTLEYLFKQFSDIPIDRMQLSHGSAFDSNRWARIHRFGRSMPRDLESWSPLHCTSI